MSSQPSKRRRRRRPAVGADGETDHDDGVDDAHAESAGDGSASVSEAQVGPLQSGCRYVSATVDGRVFRGLLFDEALLKPNLYNFPAFLKQQIKQQSIPPLFRVRLPSHSHLELFATIRIELPIMIESRNVYVDHHCCFLNKTMT